MDKADYDYAMEQPTRNLRILHPKAQWPGQVTFARIQQQIEIIYFKNGAHAGGKLEWRDIPEVKEE